MTKQKKQLAIMAVLLAVLLGVWAALSAYNRALTQQKSENAVKLCQLENIRAISYENQYGSFSFTCTDGDWSYDADPEFPLDDSHLNSIATDLSDLSAQRSFTASEELSSYGLSEPVMTVTATTESETVTIQIGSQTGSYYYAKLSGDDETIYTISSTLIGHLSNNLEDLVELETFPDMSEDKVSTITLENASGSFTLYQHMTEQEKSSSTADSSADSSSDSTADSSAETEPVIQWLLGDVLLSGDTSPLSQLVNCLDYLYFTGCHDYNASEEALTSCGILTPSATLTVTLTDGSQMVLKVGSAAADGSGYYAVLDDSSSVNIISSDYGQLLTTLTSNELLASLNSDEADSSADSSASSAADFSADSSVSSQADSSASSDAASSESLAASFEEDSAA